MCIHYWKSPGQNLSWLIFSEKDTIPQGVSQFEGPTDFRGAIVQFCILHYVMWTRSIETDFIDPLRYAREWIVVERIYMCVLFMYK